MKKQGKQYRQGDVFLIEVSSSKGVELPRVDGKIVLAYGEVTGHAHVITAERARLLEENGSRYLELLDADELLHEEHDAIILPSANYLVITQKEYTPEEIRNVKD